jgi:hypothetical protein
MSNEITFISRTKTGVFRAGRVVFGALAMMVSHNPALAIDTIEAIGAEKCGGAVKSYQIEFLAPDSASLEATAKAIVRGATDLAPEAVTLSIDGTLCTNARCGFQAKKGQTYKFAAASGLPRVDDLCIGVARP